jgi:hypothetical protein
VDAPVLVRAAPAVDVLALETFAVLPGIEPPDR